MTVTRRKMLAGVSVAITGAVAGCLGDDDEGPEAEEIYWDDTPDDVDRDDVSPPTLLVGFEWDEETGIVRVTHDGGRNIEANRLFIDGEGIAEEYIRTNVADLPDSDLSPGDDFTSGSELSVEVVDEEFRIEVVYVDDETNVTTIIDQFAVGLDEA